MKPGFLGLRGDEKIESEDRPLSRLLVARKHPREGLVDYPLGDGGGVAYHQAVVMCPKYESLMGDHLWTEMPADTHKIDNAPVRDAFGDLSHVLKRDVRQDEDSGGNGIGGQFEPSSDSALGPAALGESKSHGSDMLSSDLSSYVSKYPIFDKIGYPLTGNQVAASLETY